MHLCKKHSVKTFSGNMAEIIIANPKHLQSLCRDIREDIQSMIRLFHKQLNQHLVESCLMMYFTVCEIIINRIQKSARINLTFRYKKCCMIEFFLCILQLVLTKTKHLNMKFKQKMFQFLFTTQKFKFIVHFLAFFGYKVAFSA